MTPAAIVLAIASGFVLLSAIRLHVGRVQVIEYLKLLNHRIASDQSMIHGLHEINETLKRQETLMQESDTVEPILQTIEEAVKRIASDVTEYGVDLEKIVKNTKPPAKAKRGKK